MSAVLKFDYALHRLECANCFMTFAVPVIFETQRRRDHQIFYCPNGHQNYFSERSDLEVARQKAETAEARARREMERADNWRREAESTQRKLSATKAVATRTKARLAKGKCPRCSHEFVDLKKHMENQHPDYGNDETTKT